ncbi:PIN domain-containing protein [Flavobacterium sp. C4GT6]|uniref:PIN domain-containing protein n=1 Tax=Flavobacterium sp. C4GT6 TaxID=3103818 RepID=UPI002ED2DA42
MKYIFVDTNIFLHYRYFEEINWLEESCSEQCKIMIAPIVIDELDSKKIGTTKISTRARKVLNRIEEIYELSLSEIRKNIFFELILDKPSKSIYNQYNLNFDEQDHRLIAAILEFSKNHPVENILLYTNDVGPRLKAIQLNIKPLKPDPKYFLREELTAEEKKIKALEKENLSLKSKIPQLSLELESKNFQKFSVIKNDIESREIFYENLVKKLEIDTPYIQNIQNRSKSPTYLKFFLPSEGEIKSYNKELKNYFDSYEKSLTKIFHYEDKAGLIFHIDFTLVNEGKIPAKNIDIHLRMPADFKVIKTDDLKKMKLPTPPEKPKGGYETITIKPSSYFYRNPIKEDFKLNFVDTLKISSDSKNNYIDYNINHLKHGYPEVLEKLSFIFSEHSNIKNFKIDYIISADNMPNQVEGKLNIIFDKS